MLAWNRMYLCAGLLFLAASLNGQNLLNNPESVVYEPYSGCYLVTNYGGREIIRLEKDGSHSVFYDGLPAPRGMLLHEDVIYVVSDTGVTGFDPVTAQVVWQVDTPPWVFPNDVVADSSGYLYITDYIPDIDGGGVYRVSIADSSYIALALGINYPNGLTYDHVNDRILTCGGYPTPQLMSIPLPAGPASVALYTPFAGLDGIVSDQAGNIYISSWRDSAIYRYHADLSGAPVLFSPDHIGPADIFCDREAHVLASPDFYENLVDFIPITADLFFGMTEGDPVEDEGTSQGVSWADYDDDGLTDLMVSNLIYPGGQDNWLYHNEGDGTFAKVVSGAIVGDGGLSRTSTWGDYDNDGDPDCFVANWPDQVNFLYNNNGDGTFARVAGTPPATEVRGSPAASWVDYDNDGHLDLFVANYGTNSLFRNDGGSFSQTATGPIVTDVSDSYGAAWADIDGDGDMDVFVPTPAEGIPDKDNFLYRNNGDGSFFKETGDITVNDGGLSFGGSWGDYDNDGDQDLFVSNVSGEDNFLYQNDGIGGFSKVTAGPVVTSGGYSFGSCWGDYDNDGYLDLFVANYDSPSTEGEDFLYRNDGGGSFTLITDAEPTLELEGSYGAAWADYDRDGDLDLAVAKTEGYTNALFRNTGNRNHWLALTLQGGQSNRSGIGAVVRARAIIDGNVVRQMRQVTAQTGYCGQNDLAVHFGLGDAAVADTVRIEWPSGTVQILTEVAADQYMTVVEECCGAFTGGETGNADCDQQGKRNLSDITALITRVYIEPGMPLCCEKNGNTNGDGEGKISLSDITGLIDFVYINGTPLATCQ